MNNKQFQRKGNNALSLKDLKLFDEFIQESLDRFKTVKVDKNMYTQLGNYSKYVVSNKSNVPDLVIYNKPFNKNDCFENYNGNHFNKFPRMRFVLNSKVRKKERKDDDKQTTTTTTTKTNVVHTSEELDGEDDKEVTLTNPNLFIEHSIKTDKHIEEIENNKDDDINIDLTINNSTNNNTEDKIIKDNENDIKINSHNNELEINNNINNNNNNIKTSGAKNKKAVKNQPQQHYSIVQSEDQQLTFMGGEDKNEENETHTNTINANANVNETQSQNTQPPSEQQQHGISSSSNTNTDNTIETQQQPHSASESIEHKDNNTNQKIPPTNPSTQHNLQSSTTSTQIPPQQLPFIPPYMLFPPPMNQLPQRMTPPQQPQIPNLPLNFHPPQLLNPLPLNMNMNMNMNFNMYPSYGMEDDDDDEDTNNPLFTNFNEDYTKYNQIVYLENPVLIVKKNLIEPKWILMKNNKVYRNFNSEELLIFLADEIRQGNKFDNMSVSDYHTDVFFKPSNLFDILRKNVPKLKRRYMQFMMNTYTQQKMFYNMQMMMNQRNNMANMNMNSNMNVNINQIQK